ncbi:MAG: fluoride efflux transporter CrcB [Pseudomonadota bacterium]
MSNVAPLSLGTLLAVAAGGAVGACLRFVVASSLHSVSLSFPIGTLAVNVVGCFCAGLLLPIVSGHGIAYALLIVGFCGGFTTMSAFSLDLLNALEGGQVGKSLVYVATTLLVSLAAVYIGIEMSRWLHRL